MVVVPRKPDSRIEQAKVMFLDGMKLVEIASQLELPEGTVRRWKSTHNWDNERSEKKSERSEKKKAGSRGTVTRRGTAEQARRKIIMQRNMVSSGSIFRLRPFLLSGDAEGSA